MLYTPASGIRMRARAEMTSQIKAIARAHLAADGPNLSLRAVARDLGVVSSAVYRYFDSRDALLTALIIDGYDNLGEAAERAEAKVIRRDLNGRWMALGRGIRAWALHRPHEYALLYGPPVPGYLAPRDTVGPASRPIRVLATILRDAAHHDLPPGSDRLPKTLRTDLRSVVGDDAGLAQIPLALLARGMTAWAQLFGALGFEVFGRLTYPVTDHDAHFDYQLRAMAGYLGLA